MKVLINGQKIRADPQKIIGAGGEAEVFDLGNGDALKLFKPPTHPDYRGLPQEQQNARDRLACHQQKLPNFPQPLPSRVMAPRHLARDPQGAIVGYTMPLLSDAEPLLRYRDRAFRQNGIDQTTIVQIFQDLHDTVSKLHFAGIVIGDFNDLNVLIQGTHAYLIDADSFQFGGFPCRMFTTRFVDPLLCEWHASQPVLKLPHTADSDWYAFAILLMQCLLFVDPYGGIYKPKDSQKCLPHSLRPQHRITVFHPEVCYPKPAIPYRVLSDDLRHYFHQVFEQDWRGEFPRSLLDSLTWKICSSCHTEHARVACPNCTVSIPVQAVQTRSKGLVQARIVFQTGGTILTATVEQGPLKWLYHDRQQFCREDGSVILSGELQPNMVWRIQGQTTLLGYQRQVVKFLPDGSFERFAADSFGNVVQFDVNSTACYWLHSGQLRRSAETHGNTDSRLMGTVLPNRTRFWVGSRFGFGFYQAGELSVAFTFDARQPGLRDSVQLPRWRGQLIAANCTFSHDFCWLFLLTQAQGQMHFYAVVLQADGSVAAKEHTTDAEHWLAILGQNLSQMTGCAVGNSLFVPTDDGIMQIALQAGQMGVAQTFPLTEPYVTHQSRLLPASAGLYVVDFNTIAHLQLV